jgi:dienelactone hydrolase
MIKTKFLLFIFIAVNAYCQTVNSETIAENQYLVKPTGPYQVSFKDYHYINTNICPDARYTSNTQSYFSPDNGKFCHEIMVRIYYPSNNHTSAPYTTYYKPALQRFKSNVLSDPEIDLNQVGELDSLLSYTKVELPVAGGRFPVILFSPGLGTTVQLYENIFTQLASHGYIVVGISSLFISGDIQLPNNKIVEPQFDGNNLFFSVYPIQLSDLEYVYKQIHKSDKKVFKAMDLEHIGVLGHSLGGLAVVDAAHKNQNWFQAVATMDEGSMPEPEASAIFYSKLTTPVLYLWSAGVYERLTKNSHIPAQDIDAAYTVAITPALTNMTYSGHQNFNDSSTLQYQPLMKKSYEYLYRKNPGPRFIGDGNGFDITNTINTYLLNFFDFYLKNNGNGYNPFTGCNPIAKDSLMTCGPTTWPPISYNSWNLWFLNTANGSI